MHAGIIFFLVILGSILFHIFTSITEMESYDARLHEGTVRATLEVVLD